MNSWHERLYQSNWLFHCLFAYIYINIKHKQSNGRFDVRRSLIAYAYS